jgi:ribosome-binding protein aMBF1 (putative translation factor)
MLKTAGYFLRVASRLSSAHHFKAFHKNIQGIFSILTKIFYGISSMLRGEEKAMTVRKILGERVRRGRMALGLSQQEFAKLTGIPFPTLSRIEHGEQSLYYERVIALADTLGVSTDYLLNRTDEATPRKRPRPRKAASVG